MHIFQALLTRFVLVPWHRWQLIRRATRERDLYLSSLPPAKLEKALRLQEELKAASPKEAARLFRKKIDEQLELLTQQGENKIEALRKDLENDRISAGVSNRSVSEGGS